MSNIVRKVIKKIGSYKADYKADLHFSSELARYRLLSGVCSKLRLNRVSKKYRKKHEVWLSQYLSMKLSNIVEKYKEDRDFGDYSENAPIWVCWWSGEESAPPLVKQCIKSIYKNSGNHTVYIITKDNYMDYIDIPDYMLDKVAANKMKLAHLADYIRVSLLGKHGGLWLDATIFCASEIPEDYFRIPFFTCKSPWQECGYISYMQWVTFVLGGWKGNVAYRFLKEVFETYWSTEDLAIDYLMFDYFIDIGYRTLSGFKECLDGVEVNNLHRDDLQAAMNAALPAEDFDKVIKEDTTLYKLSWRETYSPVTADGKKSVYGHLLEMNI